MTQRESDFVTVSIGDLGLHDLGRLVRITEASGLRATGRIETIKLGRANGAQAAVRLRISTVCGVVIRHKGAPDDTLDMERPH